MKKVLLAASMSAVLMAGSWDVTPTIGGVFPEGNLDLKNQLNVGLRVGKYIDTTILSKIEVGAEFTSVNYKSVAMSGGGFHPAENTKIARYFVNFIKEFDITSKTAIYGLVGAGWEDITNEKYENDDSGFGHYGLGLKYSITEALSVKGEVRHSIKFDHGDNNVFASVGASYKFGTQPAQEVIEPKMEPVKPTEVKPAEVKTVIKDSDNDGVTDDKDLCPNTPAGQKVDAVGCVKVITLKINFGFDDTTITNEFDAQIKKVADILNSEKAYNVNVEGHADATGSEAYNVDLSQRRAEVVSKRLQELGISKDRISAKWFGSSEPVASNDTKEGRAENRRVDTTFAK